ncbi:hypothetical protein [Actinoplanes sp. NBRC 103695]|uniref:hypothetical protein n=1 Tax=Actinoplanes sp. NBRC 103695 TaxID=3032202 RepID=UPI0024A262A8|nr:hypothetical protein [Actinoplanes sp. NBRC 103695]GLY92748.1 hypothetical protein Acsp02_00040 [Actinoplanes sp. NBRC 103695]
MAVADSNIDLGNTAGLYSQIAGVLAAFAFSALLGYLRRPSAEDAATNTHRDTTVVLFTTLVALIICAITYGQVASGPADQGLTYSGFFLLGPVFCLSILGMFYAIVLAAAPFAHLGPMITAARLVATVVGPVIAMFLVGGAANDVEIRLCSGRGKQPSKACLDAVPGEAFQFGIVMSALLLVGSVYVLLVSRKATRQNLSRTPGRVGWLILGAAASTPLSAVWLASLPYDYLLPSWSLLLGQAITFAVLAMYSYAAVHTSQPAQS